MQVLCRSILGFGVVAILGLWAAPSVSMAAGGEERGSTSPLVDAAERRDWSRVADLIAEAEPDDLDQSWPDGMTALHWATHWQRSEVVDSLLEAGADPQVRNLYDVSPLMIACLFGDAAIIESLLDHGADANDSVAGGETALMRAARTGSVESVAALIANGADLNAQEQSRQTALMWAAAEGHVEVVRTLLEAGADMAIRSRSDFNAFLFAARNGRHAVAEALLEAGADIHEMLNPQKTGGRAPRKGMSALMLAVESGHFELAIDLVRRGADPNDQRSGYAPLHALSWTRKANRGEGVDGDPIPRGSGRLTSLAFVREIVALGADVNLQLKRGPGRYAQITPKGATPILLAAKTADAPLIRLLVDLGADPLLANVDETTPLMAAAGVGVRAVDEEAGTEAEVLETVALLVELGADVNAVDDHGETPMHGAAYRAFPEVVRLLTELGADPERWNHENRYGWTPLRIAQGYRPGSFKPSPLVIRALEDAMNFKSSPD